MRYFYDTEFHEDGTTIDLISIGIVAEDGREYYAISADADWRRIAGHDWLRANVVPYLPAPARWKRKSQIRKEVAEFLLAKDQPELWAWFSAYDHVVLAQLFGTMLDLPDGIPMFTNDVRSLVEWAGVDTLPQQATGVHDALEDARHVRRMFEHIQRVKG
jgi:hypothetical protein